MYCTAATRNIRIVIQSWIIINRILELPIVIYAKNIHRVFIILIIWHDIFSILLLTIQYEIFSLLFYLKRGGKDNFSKAI